jgi:hypothetical protein
MSINYYSLDEAKKELEKRRKDKILIERIENDLRENFLPFFKKKTISVMWRTLVVPNNSLYFFLACSKYVGTDPVFLEYVGDKFTSVNEDKRRLCKLKLKTGKQYRNIKICDIKENENKLIESVLLNDGCNLVLFYKDLVRFSGLDLTIQDMTEWVRKIGVAKDYYYTLLLHFLVHGILFENFFIESYDEYENMFTKECIMPVIDKIKRNYGIEPIIVKIYPEAKEHNDESFWWMFPDHINNHLMDYLKIDFDK